MIRFDKVSAAAAAAGSDGERQGHTMCAIEAVHKSLCYTTFRNCALKKYEIYYVVMEPNHICSLFVVFPFIFQTLGLPDITLLNV